MKSINDEIRKAAKKHKCFGDCELCVRLKTLKEVRELIEEKFEEIKLNKDGVYARDKLMKFKKEILGEDREEEKAMEYDNEKDY